MRARSTLLRQHEIDWFYQRGASVLYPDAWEPYLAHIPEPERGDLLSAYYRRLTAEDPAVRRNRLGLLTQIRDLYTKNIADLSLLSRIEG